MKNPTSLICFFVVCISLSGCKSSMPLFLGNSNWLIGGDAAWQFSESEIVGEASGSSGHIMTNEAFKNFILELEFRPDENINSGVFIRCKNHELTPVDCYEFNIWDHHPKQEFRTGAIVTKSDPLKRVNTVNQWNTYKIKAKGPSLKAWINGELVANLQDEFRVEGYIGLQAAESGEVRFRGVRIKILE
jgi:hypothetical protein